MLKNKFIFIYLFTDARVGNKKKYWLKFFFCVMRKNKFIWFVYSLTLESGIKK
jgi:hypothetical protein